MPKPNPTAAERACNHILGRMAIDAEVHYYNGFGTQTFQLLCEARAEYTGEPIDEVKKRVLNCSDHRETRWDKLERQLEELQEAGQEALRLLESAQSMAAIKALRKALKMSEEA